MSTRDRHDPPTQGSLPGRQRKDDPPLTTRDCATWMGVTPEFILGEIHDGRLEAECIEREGLRPLYRVHLSAFVAYLERVKFKRIPRQPGEIVSEPSTPTD